MEQNHLKEAKLSVINYLDRTSNKESQSLRPWLSVRLPHSASVVVVPSTSLCLPLSLQLKHQQHNSWPLTCNHAATPISWESIVVSMLNNPHGHSAV